MSETPNQVVSQVQFAPSGVDEQVGILLTNKNGEMATISLTLHAKQPKRATLAYDKGFIELFDYPRGQKAIITYTENGKQEVVEAGSTNQALMYEVADMEKTVAGVGDFMHLDYTYDVMKLMTKLRRDWSLLYPEEETEK